MMTRTWLRVVVVGLMMLPVAAQSARAKDGAAMTPAQQKVAWAEKQIAKNPKSARGYSELAFALARRARETADAQFYAQAWQAAEKSLALEPDNIEARKAQAWVLLGQHEFARALEAAKQVNRRWPDDVMTYGLLTDASAELGNYKEAEEAAQWMLNLRPGNIPALTRAAYLRELFGDVDGALELMQMAFNGTPSNETEDRAWLLTQIGHLYMIAGKTEQAEPLVTGALKLFPDYHYALAQLAHIRAAQKRYAEAAGLMQRRYQVAPHPENLFDVAVALERAGRAAEAQRAFVEFEAKARAESAGWDNANRELIAYYVDYAKKPAEALKLAQMEISRRRDVYTLDAYAWALSASGKHAEARKQIEAALAVGIRDARLLYHAGVIAQRQGDRAATRKYLNASLELNAKSAVAAEARKALAAARPRPAGSATMAAARR